MSTHLKDRICSAWAAAWDRGEVSALEDILAPGYTRTTAATGNAIGLDDLQRDIEVIRQGFPDLLTTIDAIVAEGDRLAIFWHSTGTHRGEVFGVPPTNRQVRTFGSNLCTLSVDRIKTEEITWDPRHLLTVLGISSLKGE